MAPRRSACSYGKAAGYEIVDGGFALSGPKYYARFRDVCLEMIRKYGVNQFKFDGTGNADTVFRGSAFDSDFSAAIHLIGELREAKPDIYINLTTGTYPSPFWLLLRRLHLARRRRRQLRRRRHLSRAVDHLPRRRHLRRASCKAARSIRLTRSCCTASSMRSSHKQLNKDPGNDFRNEVRDYFGTGTQLQEMYITPSLLTRQNWDDLAEAAKWSRANADVLKDTHWIGGDPAWLEVYGWASWSPRKGILVLRNPSDKPQSIRVDLESAFELPPGAPQSYDAKSPWKDDASKPAIELRAKNPHEFELAPFEVLTLDVTPH